MTDDLIAADLAVLARTTREPAPNFMAAMRVLARPEPDVERGRFAHVAGSAIASTVVLGCAIGLVIYGCLDRASIGDLEDGNLLDRLLVGDKWRVVLAIAALGAASYCLARLALRSVRGRTSPRLEHWATASAIAAPLAVIVVAGMAVVADGPYGFAYLRELGAVRTLTSATCAIAVVGGLAGAIVVARIRPRRTTAMIAIGCALVAATVIAGVVFDVGPYTVTRYFDVQPSIALRSALTVTGTLGLLLAISGLVLRLAGATKR